MLIKLVSVLALLTAGFASAEEIDATKTPAIDFGNLVKPKSAKVDYRYYYIQSYNSANKLSKELPIHQVRATLGFKLFSKVDTTFILAGNKFNESQKLKNRQPQVVASLPVASGDMWDLAVYADSRLPTAGKANPTEIGINPSASIPLTSEWSVSLNGEFEGVFSNDESTTVDNSERSQSFFLANDAKDNDAQIAGAKKDPQLQSDVQAMVKFTPSAMDKKLTIAAGLLFNTLWTPEYKYDEASDKTTSKYTDQSYSINRIKVDYKISENLTITDDFYYQVAGFYAEGTNGFTHTDLGRVTNRIGLSYSLF